MGDVLHDFVSPITDAGDPDIVSPDDWNDPHNIPTDSVVQSNFSASVDPTVNDDSGDGYEVGSRWINTTTQAEFVCLDDTASAAIWMPRELGRQAVAMPPGASWTNDAYGTVSAVAANGGAIANPIHIVAPMYLQSGRFRNTDASGARSFEWRLYRDVGTSVLVEVPGANGSSSYTATVSSVRDVDATGAPVLLAPGAYWLVFRNTHATNTFGYGYTAMASSTMGSGVTLISASPIAALGSTIDMTASGDEFTTAGLTRIYGMSLIGRVFGMSSGIYE